MLVNVTFHVLIISLLVLTSCKERHSVALAADHEIEAEKCELRLNGFSGIWLHGTDDSKLVALGPFAVGPGGSHNKLKNWTLHLQKEGEFWAYLSLVDSVVRTYGENATHFSTKDRLITFDSLMNTKNEDLFNCAPGMVDKRWFEPSGLPGVVNLDSLRLISPNESWRPRPRSLD